MKKLLLTVVSVAMLFTACKKNDSAIVNEPQEAKSLKIEGTNQANKVLIDAIYHGVPVKVFQVDKDTYMLGGDMGIPATELGLNGGTSVESYGFNRNDYLWPDKKMYYQFDVSANQALKDYWTAAVKFYTPLGFQFIEGSGSDGVYVSITLSPGSANAIVGKYKAGQKLNFDPASFPIGSLAHEIGHCLGLGHEQNRPDRDLYIDVNANAGSGWEMGSTSAWCVGNLDFSSIMMYSSLSAATRKDGSTWSQQRTALTATDILGLNYLYDTNGFLDNGTFEIKNQLAGKNLDLSASNGNIAIYTDHSGNNQRWTVTYIGEGFYKIVSVANPSKALEVLNSGTSAGSDVGVNTYTGADNQLWQIVPGPVNDNNFSIFPKNAKSKPLDVQNGVGTSGTNVLLGSYNLGNRTLWKFDAN